MWVNSLSFLRNSLRAASHSACETTGCSSCATVLAMMILLGCCDCGWGDGGTIAGGFPGCDSLQQERAHAARRNYGRGNPCGGCQTDWAHGELLLFAIVFFNFELGSTSLCSLAGPFKHRRPTLVDSAAMIVLNKAKRCVAKRDAGDAICFTEPVLHV